jgi:hypothetical protein
MTALNNSTALARYMVHKDYICEKLRLQYLLFHMMSYQHISYETYYRISSIISKSCVVDDGVVAANRRFCEIVLERYITDDDNNIVDNVYFKSMVANGQGYLVKLIYPNFSMVSSIEAQRRILENLDMISENIDLIKLKRYMIVVKQTGKTGFPMYTSCDLTSMETKMHFVENHLFHIVASRGFTCTHCPYFDSLFQTEQQIVVRNVFPEMYHRVDEDFQDFNI